MNRFLFAALLLWHTSLSAETYVGRVVGVADGDTVTVRDASNSQHKIRLAGIDAPEKSQPFGNASKQNLSDWVCGKAVTIYTSKVDRYKREVGKVILNGTDVNLEQVKAGLAWHYKKYEQEQPLSDRVSYTEAESVARDKRLGLWSDSDAVPPWEFRHSGPPSKLRSNVIKLKAQPCLPTSMIFPALQRHFPLTKIRLIESSRLTSWA